MKYILEILEREFERRNVNSQEMYKEINRTIEENDKLKKEVESLRNDLFELSKEYANGKQTKTNKKT